MIGKNELLKMKNALSGTEGVVYILFCGRETYVRKIAPTLVEAGIFKNEESVNQAFHRLLDKYGNSMKKIETFDRLGRRGPGRKPDIYTANLQLIFTILNDVELKFNENELVAVIKQLSFLNGNFPKFFVHLHSEENGTFSHQKIRWKHILAAYFAFLFFNLVDAGAAWNKTDADVRAKARKKLTQGLTNSLMPLRPIFQKFFSVMEEGLTPSGLDPTKIQGISPATYEFLFRASLALLMEETYLSSIRSLLFMGLNSFFKKLRETWRDLLENTSKGN